MKIFYLSLILACNPLPAASLLLGPMLGHVDDHSAKIWCALDERGEVEVRIGEDPSLKDARTITKKGFEMGSVSIDGLKADTLYYYQIQAHQYSKSDGSHFKTMKPSGESLKLRFLFSSCSGKTGSDEDATWRDIALLKDIDLILMLGDNHYADSTNPGVIKKHYLNHRSIGGFKRTTSRIPTYGIWDDHDYGPNNSDGRTKGKENSGHVFQGDRRENVQHSRNRYADENSKIEIGSLPVRGRFDSHDGFFMEADEWYRDNHPGELKAFQRWGQSATIYLD